MTNVTSSKNLLADYFGSQAQWISIHTGDPGQNGANEVSTARKQTTWAAAVGGLIVGTEVTIDVPAGTNVTHVGYWSAQTGGVCREWVDSADISFTPAGQVKITPKYQQN